MGLAMAVLLLLLLAAVLLAAAMATCAACGGVRVVRFPCMGRRSIVVIPHRPMKLTCIVLPI